MFTLLLLYITTQVYSFADTPKEEAYRNTLDIILSAYEKEDVKPVFELFNKEMADAIPLGRLTTLLSDVHREFGAVQKIGTVEKLDLQTRKWLVKFERGALDFQVTFDVDQKISGLLLMLPKPTIPVPERNSKSLRLPFNGEWLVYWGGDDKEQNHHHDTLNQRFAFDFLGFDAEGKTFTGFGERNEDYYCYGREILAPAEGLVTDVINGVRDNLPGSMNQYSALGNAVFIQHAEYEISILAHLIPDSIRVKVGEKVTAGQVLGLCGNSGNSSEPHLHYHLQNTPVIQDGTGVKVYFDSLVLTCDGKIETVNDYSPVKGDHVAVP